MIARVRRNALVYIPSPSPHLGTVGKGVQVCQGDVGEREYMCGEDGNVEGGVSEEGDVAEGSGMRERDRNEGGEKGMRVRKRMGVYEVV